MIEQLIERRLGQTRTLEMSLGHVRLKRTQAFKDFIKLWELIGSRTACDPSVTGFEPATLIGKHQGFVKVLHRHTVAERDIRVRPRQSQPKVDYVGKSHS